MKKLKKLWVLAYIFIFLTLAIVANVNIKELYSLPEDFVASYSDVDNVNEHALLGGFVKASLEENQTSVDSNKDKSGTIVFKLFNLIPIKKVNVQILPEEEVYVGGVPIGLNISTTGAMVISDTLVSTENGRVETHKNSVLKAGDIITKIDGQEVESISEIEEILAQSADDEVEVEYLRKNAIKTSKVKLLKNAEGQYKLGLWVRDDISGIGTLTFVDKNTHDYAALGHPVTDGGNVIPINDGNIYTCSLIGINKGEKNKPGELKCLFMQSDERGSIEKNTKYGIFGHIDNVENLVDNNLTAKIGGRLGVVPGRAKIVSSVSGIREEYDIEIIKANFQSKSSDKSIVFRVKDKRLLELTGGIVQGMSGSPIIQNGKIVGAVTHVFLSDPTKGYGVYSDWIVENNT